MWLHCFVNSFVSTFDIAVRLAGRSQACGRHELQISTGGPDVSETADTELGQRGSGAHAWYDAVGSTETTDGSAGRILHIALTA